MKDKEAGKVHKSPLENQAAAEGSADRPESFKGR